MQLKHHGMGRRIEERLHIGCNTANLVWRASQKFGIDQGTAMCKRILESGDVHGLHMYTLNMERSAIAILENLGLINEQVSYQPHHGLRTRPLHMQCITIRSCLSWHRYRAHCLGGRPPMYTVRRRVCGRSTGALWPAQSRPKSRKQAFHPWVEAATQASIFSYALRSNRPKAYLKRTADWDRFPTGRWGNSRRSALLYCCRLLRCIP